MTTEIEEQFFKAFGIEKIKYCKNFKYIKGKCERPNSKTKCFDCIGTNEEYPEITDRKLLELICIVYKAQGIELTIDDVKNEVLNNCIKYKDDIKHQIQQLFKEEE